MEGVIVVGLGNLLMSDEGVGVHVVRRLMADPAPPGVDYCDIGTGGLRMMHLLAGRRKVVFVDCAMMGESPGNVRRFTPDDVESCKCLPGFSLHEGDLLGTLALARSLGECPAEVVIFGIQPERVVPGMELSTTLRARVEEYAALVRKELTAEKGA